MTDPRDLPRQRLIDLAEETLANYAKKGVTAQIHFKFTCAHCGARCTLAQPNRIYDRGECHGCGKETEITEGGFMLIFGTGPGVEGVEEILHGKAESEN